MCCGLLGLTKGQRGEAQENTQASQQGPLTIALTAPRSDLPNLLVVSHDVGPVLWKSCLMFDPSRAVCIFCFSVFLIELATVWDRTRPSNQRAQWHSCILSAGGGRLWSKRRSARIVALPAGP